ncbi:MAG: hypothetical protein IAE85_03845 [Anaerolinea sp.]|nr:hypothetical protein [Anaerolinea sp.]
MDTRAGHATRYVLALAVLVAASVYLWHDFTRPAVAGEPALGWVQWVVQVVIMIVSALISMALAPKPQDAKAQKIEIAKVEDGATLKRIYGPVWIDDPIVIGDKPMGTVDIRKRAGKTWTFKTKWQTVGHWYLRLFHFMLCKGPIDRVLAIRVGGAEAWIGNLADSGTITVSKQNLFGGEDAEGGIDGDFEFMFGHADQLPNTYLASNLAPEQSAYRGRASVVFKGGRWGTSPYFKSPSFFVSRILSGWDNDSCWYPEKAEVPLAVVEGTVYPWLDADDPRNPENIHQYRVWISPFSPPPNDRPWRNTLEEAFADGLEHGDTADDYAVQFGWSFDRWRINRAFDITPGDAESLVLHFNRYSSASLGFQAMAGAVAESSAILCTNFAWMGMEPGPDRKYWTGLGLDGGVFSAGVSGGFFRLLPGADAVLAPGENVISNCAVPASPPYIWPPVDGLFPVATVTFDRHVEVRRVPVGGELVGMNPAHILYDSVTAQEMDGEPIALMDDASWRAAADRLHAEGIGIGTVYDASAETIEAFQQRLCNIAGGSLSRDPTTGKWHFDLIRDDIGITDLPVLGDDDILEFERQSSILDEAVNQVVVEWFNPLVKENRSTAPMQSLGAIQAFGAVNGEVRTYREVLTEDLALRLAARDLRARATPLERLTATTTRRPYAWRTGRKFRVQAPRRGIADMVCVLGDTDRGTLRSGAMTVSAVQDVASMPDATYVVSEPGVAPPISSVAQPALAQHIFETPYRELVEILTTPELAFLTATDGYASVVAARPPGAIDYRLMTRTGVEDFTEASAGDWCPTALVVEACAAGDILRTAFTLSTPLDLAQVGLGQAALWGEEIVRVDALDLATLAVTLARGCADTVPQLHPAGQRIWFFDAYSTGDPVQRSDGTTLDARVLTRTGSDELAIGAAPTSSLPLASRQARPYPPAGFLINGQASPSAVTGDAVATWVHRDRLLQADQLVDTEAATIGPEPGTTYTLRAYVNNVLDDEQTGITGTTATWSPSAAGQGRVEVVAVRDGLESWQAQVLQFPIGGLLLAEDGEPITTEDLLPILME